MIAFSEPLEFIPRGRQAVEEHPSCVNSKKERPTSPLEHVLLQRMQNVNISAVAEEPNEFWSVREIYETIDNAHHSTATASAALNQNEPSLNFKLKPTCEYMCDFLVNSEEELYVKKCTAVWTKGLPSENYVLPRMCFTCETTIKFAFFCSPSFVRGKREMEKLAKNPYSKKLTSIGLIDQNCLRVYCSDGEDFRTPLEFPISNVWQTSLGLLLEKNASSTIIQNHTIPMPRLFSLAHPLDEICPVLNKSPTNVVNYLIESEFKIIYSSDTTDLLLLFDSKIGKHFISRLRKATQDEVNMVSSQNETALSGTLHQLSVNRGGLSAGGNYPGSSSFSQNPLKYSGPTLKNSTANLRRSSLSNTNYSAHISKFLTSANSFSEGFAGPNRTGSPLRNLQSTIGQQSISVQDIRKVGQSQPSKPIVPDLCLEHIWTENTFGNSREFCEMATSAFLHRDLVGQNYLCYLLSRTNKLQLVSLSNYGTDNLQISTMPQTIAAKDAVSMQRMKMLAVIDPSGTLVLYSGTAVIAKVHVNIPLDSVSLASSKNGTPVVSGPKAKKPSSFKRSSLLPMQKTTDNSFDDELHLLSPVPTLQSQTNNPNGSISLRDPAGNRLTLVYGDDKMYRITLPVINETKLVSRCIAALQKILKKDQFLQMIGQWYGVRNRPGSKDFTITQEWQIFCEVLLSLMGFAPDPTSNTSSSFNMEEPKKRRKNGEDDEGSNDDWDFMCNILAQAKRQVIDETKTIIYPNVDVKSSLFTSIPAIFYGFHLLYEDFKMDESQHDHLLLLAKFLYQFALDMQLSTYIYHYSVDFPQLLQQTIKSCLLNEQHGSMMHHKELLQVPAPSVYSQLEYILKDQNCLPYNYVEGLNDLSRNILQIISLILHGHEKMKNWIRPLEFTSDIQSNYIRKSKRVISTNVSRSEQLIQMLINMKINRNEIERFPVAIHMIMAECLEYSRMDPPIGCSTETYDLILRSDLAAHVLMKTNFESPSIPNAKRSDIEHSLSPRKPPSKGGVVNEDNALEDGMDNIDTKLLSLRFPDDTRINEVRNLLNSSDPVLIDITQNPGTSDHEFIEEQEKQLYAFCARTMALPLGRGMFTLRTIEPTPTESMPIPRLCLTGKEAAKGATIEMQQIEFPQNMNLWPTFHNGVAAGLQITPNAKDVDSTWIVYNKPKTSCENAIEHAGFLMALGLNGHLKTLSFMSIYEYLVKCDEMTSVGLLLGISSTHRGTMNNTTTKLLSVHIEALLPATALELDIPQNIQIASIMGIGLLYQSTAKRHIAEVLLQEIGRPPGPEMENSIERESYSLTAGLALGLVTLGQGETPAGLRDLQLPDTLHYYMVGGVKRPLTGAQKEKYKLASFQVREGDNVNIDVTAPGATLALGLMFFNTNNKAIAEWMNPPKTRYQLDLIRPDLLLLRTIAKGLIMWQTVEPTETWLFKQFPSNLRFDAMRAHVSRSDDMDHEAVCQAYCNIVAGAAFVMGLKYAGTENPEAFKALRRAIKLFLGFNGKYVGEYAGKTTIENSLMIILLSISMVFAGSGDLEILRIIRYLRSRIGTAFVHVTYGSHMAIHLSLGLLFLGAGRFTLSNSPEAVAALVCAFFPKLPIHSNDNRYHLQAFRHLYVLAVEPRLFLPRDINTKKLCLCNISVLMKGEREMRRLPMAPCMLPPLNTLQKVVVDDSNYWPVAFEKGRNWDLLEKALANTACIDIKKRSGCLSHLDDPDRLKSLLAQTLTSEQYLCWEIDPKSLGRFSSDPYVIAFMDRFLLNYSFGETQISLDQLAKTQRLTVLFYNALVKDKLHVFPIYMGLFGLLVRIKEHPYFSDSWQFKLIDIYLSHYDKEPILFCKELLSSLIEDSKTFMENSLKECSLPLRNFLTQDVFSLFSVADVTPDCIAKMLFIINFYNLSPNFLNFCNLTKPPTYAEFLILCSKLNLESPTIYCLLRILKENGIKL